MPNCETPVAPPTIDPCRRTAADSDITKCVPDACIRKAVNATAVAGNPYSRQWMPHSGLAQRGSPVFTVAEVKHQLGITYAGANALVFRFAETSLVHEVTDADAIASSNADQFSNCSMARINRDLDAAASSGSETIPLNGNPESSPQRQ